MTYCCNLQCRNSEIAANQMLSTGYADVRMYAAGEQDRVAAGLLLEAGAPA